MNIVQHLYAQIANINVFIPVIGSRMLLERAVPRGGEFTFEEKGLISKLKFYECSNSGHRKESSILNVWKNALSAKELLIKAGWDVLE